MLREGEAVFVPILVSVLLAYALEPFVAVLSIIALLTFLLLVTGDFYKRKLAKMAGRRREDQKLTVDVIRTIDRQIMVSIKAAADHTDPLQPIGELLGR